MGYHAVAEGRPKRKLCINYGLKISRSRVAYRLRFEAVRSAGFRGEGISVDLDPQGKLHDPVNSIHLQIFTYMYIHIYIYTPVKLLLGGIPKNNPYRLRDGFLSLKGDPSQKWLEWMPRPSRFWKANRGFVTFVFD